MSRERLARPVFLQTWSHDQTLLWHKTRIISEYAPRSTFTYKAMEVGADQLRWQQIIHTHTKQCPAFVDCISLNPKCFFPKCQNLPLPKWYANELVNPNSSCNCTDIFFWYPLMSPWLLTQDLQSLQIGETWSMFMVNSQSCGKD